MTEERITHIYVYTIKSIMENNIQQNFDLIPKLFSNNDIHSLKRDPNNQRGLAILHEEIQNIKQTFRLRYPELELNKVNIYRYLLIEYTSVNLTKVNFTYFPIIYHNCIIDLLNKYIQEQSLLNSVNDEYQIDLFIKHLLNGHEMQYGLYFSFKFAYNDDDFLRITKKEIEPNMNMIYFAKLEELLNYITPIKLDIIKKYSEQDIDFEPPLLYANNGWDYGIISDGSQKFKCGNKIQFYTNIMDMIDLSEGELVCQIPLPMNLFRTIFISKGTRINFWPENIMQQKYLKYKQKYLELKKLNN